jgi:hypothetical protein
MRIERTDPSTRLDGAATAPLAGESTPTAESAAPRTTSDAGAAGSFAQVLHGLGREIDQGEATLRTALAAMHGRDLGPDRLLALQAGVYRYSEAIDLTSRLVDRATGSVKTILQGGNP